MAFSGYKNQRRRTGQRSGKTEEKLGTEKRKKNHGREKKTQVEEMKKTEETEDEQAEKPEEKTRKKPLEREESPGNKHTERIREQPRRANQNCRTVIPLFLLKETEECVEPEKTGTRKARGEHRG
jgi:hypothetical protein